MSAPSLLELSQRDEAFWVGLVLLLGGSLLAQFLTPAGTTPDTLAWSVAALGGVVLTVRLLVGVARMLGVIGGEAADGYREGRQ
jgi:hypothetical protein